MKKFLISSFILISSMVFAQSGPKIEFTDADNTIDYGTVSKDSDNGVRIFKFKNTGDQPLLITKVQSTCGCTVPTQPKEPILPGKMGEIEVKYNMNPGPIRKTITVETNAINITNGQVAIKIKGEVIVKPIENVLEKKKVGPMQ